VKIKTQSLLLLILIFVLGVIGVKAILETSIEKTIMVKELDHITELKSYFKESDILVPQYHFRSDNPYEYTAVENYALEKSKQGPDWDGYDIIITPTKLSDSECFKIVVMASGGKLSANTPVEWRLADVSQAFNEGDRRPRGDYLEIAAVFQEAKTLYEVVGYVFGVADDARFDRVKNELSYILGSLQRVED